jgi:5-methylcytosine-specific restriction protein A
MPVAPARPCPTQGCPNLQPCSQHRRIPWLRSPTITRQQRGYDHRHEFLRRRVLREEPLCRACRIRTSVICDHIVPLSRGGQTVRSNLQGLCTYCHRSKTGREGQAAR